MKWKKLVSILLLVSLVLSGIPSRSFASSSGIFLNISTARAITTNLKVCNQQLPYYEKKTTLLTSERDLLKEKADILIVKNKNLDLNVTELTKQKEEFKASYLQANEDLNKVRESVPSRFVWFGAGSITTAIAILIGVIAIK